MKKNKQKAQLKANRKKSIKAVKANLVNDLSNLISSFAEPNRKLKKLIEKAASSFAKEIEKTAKPVTEAPVVANDTKPEEQDVKAKAAKPRTTKKSANTEQE
ncbi:hypothetical protein [Nubsella zeaxanthinifaciens]|uniref:hypothetical protein n=1 Tax=Nubsella zeaxanthinifaciens TaxID=392412 RepID=UPI000DE574CB|nr:hypothetical protein [Nubsella zeaxanthinifaciens]